MFVDNLRDFSADYQTTEVYIVNTDRQSLRGFNPGKSFELLLLSTSFSKLKMNHEIAMSLGFKLEKLVLLEHAPHQPQGLVLARYSR